MRQLLFIITTIILVACEKSNDYVINQDGKQSDLYGQWVRGQFEMDQFWNYSPAPDSSINLFTQAFAFDTENGCEYFDIKLAGQLTDSTTLTWLYGTCRFDMEKMQFSFIPEAGIHRSFPPGSSNATFRLVTEEELLNSRVTYNLQTGFLSNQPFLAVSFGDTPRQRLVFQKTSW